MVAWLLTKVLVGRNFKFGEVVENKELLDNYIVDYDGESKGELVVFSVKRCDHRSS